jgi:hypothetical protein
MLPPSVEEKGGCRGHPSPPLRVATRSLFLFLVFLSNKLALIPTKIKHLFFQDIPIRCERFFLFEWITAYDCFSCL